MGDIVLVTGGGRSGKSAFAERLAVRWGERVTYLATAEALDAEMAARIDTHRARRPPAWSTVEAPWDLLGALQSLDKAAEVVLVDALSIWTSNRLLALGDPGREGWWTDVAELERTLTSEAAALVAVARNASWRLVLVTDEVGLGLVPPFPLGRAFRDLLGRLNQAVATQADAIFLVVAGMGVEITRLAVTPEAWNG